MGDDLEELENCVHVDGEDSSDQSLRVMSAGNSKEFETDDYMNLFAGTSNETEES